MELLDGRQTEPDTSEIIDGVTRAAAVDGNPEGTEYKSGVPDESGLRADYWFPFDGTNMPFAGRDITGHGIFNRAGSVDWTGVDRVVQSSDANIRAFETLDGIRAGRNIPAFTNLITYSEAFRAAVSDWTNTRCSVTDDATTAPDGNATADKMVEDNDINQQHLLSDVVVKESFTDDADVTFSIYLKVSERPWVRILMQTKAGNNPLAFFNLSTGAVGTESVDSYGSEELSNGWRRFWITNDIENGANDITFQVSIAVADGDNSYDGDGSSGIYVWGAMAVEHPQPVPYIPTSGAAASNVTESGQPFYKGTIAEDYQTGNDTNSGTHTVTNNVITVVAMDRDTDDYVSIDKGASFFGDFYHEVDVNVTALVDHPASRVYFWAVTDADDDLKDIDDASGDAVFMYVGRSAPATYTVNLLNLDGGTLTQDLGSVSVSVGTEVFLGIYRSGTVGTVEIYSTTTLRAQGGSGDIETLSLTVVDTTFQYVQGISTYNDGQSAKDISGTISNLNIGTMGGVAALPVGPTKRVEDFGDYAVTDPNSKSTADGDKITVDGLDRNEDCYRVRDLGPGFFRDFVHKVDVNVTALTDDGLSRMYPWAMSNSNDDLKDIDDLSGDAIWLRFQHVDATHYAVVIQNLNAGAITTSSVSSSIAVNTKVFVSPKRSLTTFTAEIYSTAELRLVGAAGDIDTLTLTVVNTPFRYIYGVASYNRGSINVDISGTIENLDIGTRSELFEERLGQELVTDGAFDNIDLAGAKVISGITKANPGVVTFAAGSGYINGQVVLFEDQNEMVEVKDKYWKLRSPGVGASAEQVTDGDMSVPGSWTIGANWAIAGGVATHTDGASDELNQDVGFANGKYYALTFTTTNRTQGTLSVFMGGSNVSFGIFTTNDTFTVFAKEIPGGNGNIIFRAGSWDGDVDDVSVKEITTFELSDQTIDTWDDNSLDTSGFGAAETTGGTAKAVSFTDWIFSGVKKGWQPGVDGAGALTNTLDSDGSQDASFFSNVAQANILPSDTLLRTLWTISNRVSGTAYIKVGNDGDLKSQNADGTNSYYLNSGSDDDLFFQSSVDFIGSIDDVSVKQVTNAWDGLPPHFTMVVLWRPGFDAGDTPAAAASYGIVSVRDGAGGLLYHPETAFVATWDGTSSTTAALNWTKDTWYKLAVQLHVNSNVYQFRVGAEALGSTFDASSWGSWADFVGSFVTGENGLQIGKGLFGQMHTADLRFVTRKLLNAEIDAL